MNPVTSWRNRAQALYQPEKPVILTHPQANFRYPRFAELHPSEIAAPGEALRGRLTQAIFERTTLFSSLEAAYMGWLQSLDSKKELLIYSGPLDPNLQSAIKSHGKFRALELPREPSEFIEALERELPNTAGVALSNPSRVDGFFMPLEMTFKMFQDLRSRHRTVPVLHDESVGLFSFNEIAPGSLRSAIQADPALTLSGSVFPVMNPQGPEVAWLLQNAQSGGFLSAVPSNEELIPALQAVQSFSNRQNAAVAEFSRRMLAVERALKTLAVHLQKLSAQRFLKVTLWPETGFQMTVEILEAGWRAPFATGTGVEDWCLQLFEKHGLLFTPGTLFGRPREIGINYAALIQTLDDAGARFVSAFTPPAAP